MKLMATAFKYLKEYPILAVFTLVSIMIASLFEGASFGMLIPLIQTMTADTSGVIQKIHFMDRLGLSFSGMNIGKTISVIFLLIFFLIVIKNIFIYMSNILIARLRLNTVRNLRVNLMNNILGYDMAYFDKMKTGHVINNLNSETQRIGIFMQSVLQFVALAGRVITYILILFLISWKATMIASLLIASVLTPIELIMKKIKKIGRRISKAMADYNSKLTEILGGIRLIKGYGTEEFEKKNFKTLARDIYHSEYANYKHLHLLIPLSETLILGLIILSFLGLVNVARIDISKTFPFIVTYLIILTRALTQLNQLNNLRSTAISNLAAFENYEEMNNSFGKKTIESGHMVIDEFRDSLEFKDVSFSYEMAKKTLENINIKIPKGKITAIIGLSGAGKSTMVNLIPRFYDVFYGKILVDGVDVKKLDLRLWRKKIGFVSQDIFIFNADIKYNIAYGCDMATDEDIIEAARIANAHDFIMNLPEKYNTILGERGVNLSGGEKQRISIARAIIHNPEILILDEATSALDTETERLIKEAINRLTKNRTVIAIAHRLSTIVHADNIIVLHEGKVLEEGKHADLLKKSELYKKLCESQFNLSGTK